MAKMFKYDKTLIDFQTIKITNKNVNYHTLNLKMACASVCLILVTVLATFGLRLSSFMPSASFLHGSKRALCVSRFFHLFKIAVF